MIRALVVDDHPTLRAGVLQAIKEASDIEVVGEAATGPELWASLAELQPDVVLLDPGAQCWMIVYNKNPYHSLPL